MANLRKCPLQDCPFEGKTSAAVMKHLQSFHPQMVTGLGCQEVKRRSARYPYAPTAWCGEPAVFGNRCMGHSRAAEVMGALKGVVAFIEFVHGVALIDTAGKREAS
jgi:hypothetical protein